MGLPIELNWIYWDSMGFNQQKLRIYRELMGLKPIQNHCVCVFVSAVISSLFPTKMIAFLIPNYVNLS
jgi:hypothetical protein